MAQLQDYLNGLYEASFNGIQFLYESDSTQTGKMTTTHLYPFKTYSYTEELGQKLRSFSMKAIVAGDDYDIRRDALALALRIKGTGILIHTFYGMVTVICTGFTIDHSTTELGMAKFDINFEESLLGIFPSSIGTTISTVTSLATSLIKDLNNNVSSQYTINYPENINDSATKCITLNDTLKNAITASSNITTSSLNDFSISSTNYLKNVYANVQDPTLLGAAITGLINDYNDIGTTFEQSYALCVRVYEFGSDDRYIDYNTLVSDEEINNAQVINSTSNGALLINMYQNACMITYDDTNELDYIVNDLETRYQYFLSNNNLPSILLRTFERLRTATKQYLNSVRVDTNKVVQVDVLQAPLTVLLYKYYANFDYESEIVRLNSLKDVSVINGNINMVTEN
jgi:prophage DNA circulation protein